MIDMYLNEECQGLTHQEIQNIFDRTERCLINMVPNRIEIHIKRDPENKVWMLRPEARYNGKSQLSYHCDNPDKVAEILNNVKDADLAADEGQVPNLAQELFEDCDDFAKAILLKDANMPIPKDFSFDLNMISPIA